ncbi:MAG: molybdopterin cofactor-binding domain-containing protein, partial [Gammaproteobacteria bacterium]
MNKPATNLSRRKFLITSTAISGGFALGLQIPGTSAQQEGQGNNINIWVEIHADDAVTIKYARTEMGQGSLTSAPQLVADELDADWNQVS